MNLFLISQFGQLLHHQALIKRDSLANNQLVILYTELNTEIPEKIRNAADESLFDSIVLHKLPVRPNNPEFKKLNMMWKGYKKLLNNVENLYVSSFESHYNICINIAKNRNIKVHLIEEGLATYKFVNASFSQEKPKFTLKKIVIKSGLVDNKLYPFLKSIYKYSNDLLKLPYQVFLIVRGYVKSDALDYKRILSCNDERRSFFSFHNEFDSVNVAYPAIVKKCFKSSDFSVLNSYGDDENICDVKEKLGSYEITASDSIYVTQPYPLAHSLYTSCIVHYLNAHINKYGGKVYVKFHPRDKEAFKEEFSKQIRKLNPDGNIILLHECDFPIEPMITQLDFKFILGISSTALVYANQMNENIVSISVTNEFLRLVGKRCPPNAKEIITSHTNMLKAFTHIQFN